MKNTKFVKARCDKTGQYFGLEVLKKGLEWKVVNFLPIPTEEGKLVTSEVKQASFFTETTLLACPTCGNRKLGGCSCATKRGCPGPEKGLINCAYCSHLKIDYSGPDLSSTGHKPGEVIRLSQGQEIKITAPDGRKLERIKIVCGWLPSVRGASMDVDSSVYVMGQTGYDIVYFGSLTHPSGCVVHHGDDLTGGDNEYIDIDFRKVPADKDKLIFVINIYNCADRKQTLGDVRDLFISLRDPDSQKPLIEYKEMGNMRRNTALVIAMAARKGGDWYFQAIGKPSNATSVRELGAECFEAYKNK